MSAPPIDIQAIATARYEEAWRQWFIGDSDINMRQAEFVRVAESADDLARTLQYRFAIEVHQQETSND